MKATQLISELSQLISKYGDREVVCENISSDDIDFYEISNTSDSLAEDDESNPILLGITQDIK